MTAMSLSSVPLEVLEQIFAYILFSNNRPPTALLRTNRLINEICTPMLHADLVFNSTAQLNLFASQCQLSVPPRSFSLSLPGAVVDPNIFTCLYHALGCCVQRFPAPPRLQLHSMRLCLNSHPMNAEALLQALSLVECVLKYPIPCIYNVLTPLHRQVPLTSSGQARIRTIISQ